MSKKQSVIIVICAVLLVILGFAGYKMLESKYKKDLDTALEENKSEWQEKNKKLTVKIDRLKKTISNLSGDTGPIPDEEVISGDESESAEPVENSKTKDSIDEVERRIASFFVHLDEQEYVRKYKLKGSSYDEYEDAIQKLSEKPPLLTNETESLYSMFLNIAHFYRVLGKEKLSLFKDVIENESDTIESTMRDFYLWYTDDGEGRKKVKGRPSQEVLYEYAGFFLDTIGGRNYLMRRDSKIRILTSYYSVLILDRANDMKQNPNGIDIRPYIRMVISDLSNKSGFIFHSEYIRNLNMLKEKYNID